MLHFGEAAQQTSGTQIASLLHTNGLVNSPMRLIATFKCGRGVSEGRKPSSRGRPPLNQPPSSLTSHLPPPRSLVSVPHPLRTAPPGIKLELAESSDMLITGLALL